MMRSFTSLELCASAAQTPRSRFQRPAQILYGNQGATSVLTSANRREHRNRDAFRRNGARTGFLLTADSERSAGNEFSAADFESARNSIEEVLSRFRIAAISSGLK